MLFLKNISKTATPTIAVPLTKAQKWRLAIGIFFGKILGLLIVLVAMKIIPNLIATKAFAGDTYTPHETSMINSINTVWTLVAAFLVFGMQAGFVMLEAGFARARETVNVLMECIFDTCLCGLLFWAIGYSFMFSHGNGFIGMNWFFLQGGPVTYEGTGIPLLAHWIFQFAFADTCSTIVSGAMIGRTSFRGDIHLQHGYHRIYISYYRALGLGTRRISRNYGKHRKFPAKPRSALPRFCRIHGCTYDRGDCIARRSHRARAQNRAYF